MQQLLSLHLSVQQDLQPSVFASTEEDCANVATVRIAATDKTPKIRFMEISLTFKLREGVADGREGPTPLQKASRQELSRFERHRKACSVEGMPQARFSIPGSAAPWRLPPAA
jgi:hypothetical protein